MRSTWCLDINLVLYLTSAACASVFIISDVEQRVDSGDQPNSGYDFRDHGYCDHYQETNFSLPCKALSSIFLPRLNEMPIRGAQLYEGSHEAQFVRG